MANKVSKCKIDPIAKPQILVIKLGALGDFILADSAFKAIREKYPDAKISLLTTSVFEDFAKKIGYFDEVLVVERFSFFNFTKLRAFVGWIKETSFEMIFDLQMVDRTQTYYYLFKLFAKQPFVWVGHVRASSYFLEDVYFKRHPRERFARLLSKVGITKIDHLDVSRFGEVINIKGLNGKYIFLVPRTSNSLGGAKMWPLEEYRKLIAKLTEKGFKVAIIGGKGEDNSELLINDQVFDLAGKTNFNQVIHLAAHAYAAIGGDTGPMHMAAASKAPVFVLFSKKTTPAEQVGPISKHYRHFTCDDLQLLKVEQVWPEIENFLNSLR